MKMKLLFAATALLTIPLIGCEKENESVESSTPFAVPVVTQSVQQGEIIEGILFSGRLEGMRDVMIKPQIPGKIEEIQVKVGQRVQKDTVLVRMDASSLDQAKAQYEAAKKTYERMKSLYEDKLIAPQAFDQAKAGYETANAGYNKVLESTVLHAPFPGTIVGKYFNEHDIYSPGRRGILRLAQTETLKIPITIAAGDYADLREGMNAVISVDTRPDEIFRGKLADLSPGADPVTGLFDANVTVGNSEGKLQVGVFAKVEVVIRQSKDALIVPRSALIRSESGDTVFVLEGEHVRRRIVQTGIVRPDSVEIASGLDSNDVIVTEGALGLEDGTLVRPTSEGK